MEVLHFIHVQKTPWGFRCSSERCAENGVASVLFLLLSFVSAFEHNCVWSLIWKNTFIFYSELLKNVFESGNICSASGFSLPFLASSLTTVHTAAVCFLLGIQKKSMGLYPIRYLVSTMPFSWSFTLNLKFTAMDLLQCPLAFFSPLPLLGGCLLQIWFLCLLPWQFWYCSYRDVR